MPMIEPRRRVATFGDQVIRGIALISDENGPDSLAFKPDGASGMVILNTRLWKVQWESVYERAKVF